MSTESRAVIVYGSDGVGGYEEKGVENAPLRTDPTGETDQPITAESLPLPTGAATSAAQTDGTQKSIVRGGAKGTTVAGDVTSESIDANRQALHVKILGGSGGPSQDVNVAGWFGATTPIVGQKVMAESLPVVIAEDQTAIPVVISGAAAVDLVVDYLKNGSAYQMKVNASGTPQVFQFPANPTYDISIFEVRMVFAADILNWNATGFGKSASGILTNGILVDMIVNGGVAISLSNIRVNLDFLRTFGEIPVVNSSTSGDIIVAAYRFADQLRLKAGTADTFKVTIRDNLINPALGIQYLTATFYGHKV